MNSGKGRLLEDKFLFLRDNLLQYKFLKKRQISKIMPRLTFYISAKWEDAILVEKLHRIIREHGHDCLSEWTTAKVEKPYDSNISHSERNALRDLEGVTNSDVYILLTDEQSRGLGKYIEQGAAMAAGVLRGKPLIYLIGKDVAKSQFNFHPLIRRRQTEDVSKTLIDIIHEVEGELLP